MNGPNPGVPPPAQNHGAVRLGRDLALVDAGRRGRDRRLEHGVSHRCRLARIRDLARRLDQSQLVDQTRPVEPGRPRRAREQRLVDPRRQEQAALLDADARAGEAAVAQHRAGEARRVLVVGIADEAGAAHLILDRDALHRARDQRHLARRGHDQQMQREEALMIETGQIEDVLGRADHEPVQSRGRHGRAQLLAPRRELLVGKDPLPTGHRPTSPRVARHAVKPKASGVRAPSSATRLASTGRPL